VEPGFVLCVMELSADHFLILGLVSPLPRAREEVLRMVATVAQQDHLQVFCDQILQSPLMTLDQLEDYVCLLGELMLNREIERESILFMDVYPSPHENKSPLERQLFEQRESAVAHVPMDFATAFCNAVEQGNRSLLERRLATPMSGRIGRMSANDLRQEKYSFIALATLSSRAAIRGGVPAETAFSLSDLYCQRVDLMKEIESIHELAYRMLIEYCDRVREIRERPIATPTIHRALAYISVHLHEAIGLEELSSVCGLCTRSLSLRFRAEMGMGIGEYIHREKIKEAEYLLRFTDYTLSQVTAYLNYSSQSYFTKIFRQTCGLTPQQYRDKSK
jgi:AraC-like DNA-binding protein